MIRHLADVLGEKSIFWIYYNVRLHLKSLNVCEVGVFFHRKVRRRKGFGGKKINIINPISYGDP
jgi:hypothetical protein